MNNINRRVVYLFTIKTKNGKEINLTSFSFAISHNAREFKPNSGLNLMEATFDDSAHNQIIIHGLFEKGGIELGDMIVGSEVEITENINSRYRKFITYECSSFESHDLEFKITLVPMSVKLERSIVKNFSKTCRANFGDKKCNVNISKYMYEGKITYINDNILITDLAKEYKSGYFNNGIVTIIDNKIGLVRVKVLSHADNMLEIEDVSGLRVENIVKFTVYPSCDKNFSTCLRKYDNVKNFRGEPMIPEDRIIEN